MAEFQFEIIDSRDREFFIAEVNRKLNEGWELHGDIKAFPIPELIDQVNDVRYIQAFKTQIIETPRRGNAEVTIDNA